MNLDQLHVFLVFDPLHLPLDFIKQNIDSIFQVDLARLCPVRIEPDEDPLSRMNHVQVIIPDLFVIRIVVFVCILVRLDRQYRIPNQFAVVHSSSMRTPAVSSVQWLVMHKSLKSGLDRVSHANLLGVFMDDS